MQFYLLGVISLSLPYHILSSTNKRDNYKQLQVSVDDKIHAEAERWLTASRWPVHVGLGIHYNIRTSVNE